MTATQRKWFFPIYDEAQPYLDEHYSRTSAEWKCCSNCTPSAARPADPEIYLPLMSAGRASAPAAHSAARAGADESADTSLEFVSAREDHRQLEVWCDAYLPFEPRSSEARQLRIVLRRELRALRARPAEILHAVFAGDVPPRADVENLLLYNVDMEGGCFEPAAGRGLRFELATRTPSRSPSGRDHAYAYSYRAVPESDSLQHWRPVRTLARWDAIALGRRPALDRVWLALRRAARAGQIELASDRAARSTRFAVRLVVGVPAGVPTRTATLVKPSIDGVVCALQAHGDGATIGDVAQRLARRLDRSDVDARDVAELLRSDDNAVLGVVPHLVMPRGNSIQWAPGDDVCVAGEVLITEATRWTLAGELIEVAPNDLRGTCTDAEPASAL